MIPRTLKFVYYVLITSAFCANILVVAQTTILSVLGSSLALRGQDGSMMTATDGLYAERDMVFRSFGHGLLLTIGSVVMCVWLHLHWEASLICCGISVWTIMRMRETYYRIMKKFDFDESMTVDFQDIFDGPAAIHAVSASMWKGMGRGMQGAMNMANVSSLNGTNGSFEMDNSAKRRNMEDGSSYASSDEEDGMVRQRNKTQAMQMV